jgi:hypothetical protein
MSSYWLVLRCGDLDSVDVMGLYTTKIKGINKILELQYSMYETLDHNDISRIAKKWFKNNTYDSNNITWNNFKNFFKNQLKINEDVDSECSALYIYYYKIIKCFVDA